MLKKDMPLVEMINYKPSDKDMLALPMEAVVYIKVSIVSLYKEDNYDFIRYLFETEDISNEFLNISDTIIYDFDGTSTNQSRFVTIFELLSLYTYANVSEYLKDILEEYNHVCDVLIDFYTYDNEEYRLSNLDGIVKLEKMNHEVS